MAHEQFTDNTFLDSLLSLLEERKILYTEDMLYDDKIPQHIRDNYYNFYKYVEYLLDEAGYKPIDVDDFSMEFHFCYKGEYYTFEESHGQGTCIILRKADKIPDEFVVLGDNKFDGENELIQYIIVNKDLGMSTGKIAAQVGHVCTICAVKELETVKFKIWFSGSQKKIILEAHQKVLEKLESEGYYSIHDLGLTEIPENSLTAVSLGIKTRTEAASLVKRLQILKG